MTEKRNFFKFKDGKPVEAVIYSYGKRMTENKRYENVAKDDSVVIQDNMLHCVFVDCDEIVEVLNEKEAFMLHYEKRLSELQREIAKLKGKTNVPTGNLQPTGDDLND